MPTTATKERPILFSGPMVRAILDGQKTQTRRIVKPQPETYQGESGLELCRTENHRGVQADQFTRHYCPYGAVGDRLYVRETWAPVSTFDPSPETGALYRADYRAGDLLSYVDWKWRPSIHMPRWASRITLEITARRAERLGDISEDDAIAEGIERTGGGRYFLSVAKNSAGNRKVRSTAVECFRDLWESCYGPGSWERDKTKWVWVCEFRRLEGK